MHVARARQLSWTDSLFPLCFLCGKGTEGLAVTAVVFLGFNLLNARRGVKPTLATLGARLVVVIRSCWIFATIAFFSVQRLLASARSFNTFDCMLQKE